MGHLNPKEVENEMSKNSQREKLSKNYNVLLSDNGKTRLEELGDFYDASRNRVIGYLIEDEYDRKILYPPRMSHDGDLRQEVCFQLTSTNYDKLKALAMRFKCNYSEVIRALIDEEWERKFGKWKM